MTLGLSHSIGGRHPAGHSGSFGNVFDPDTGEVQALVPLARIGWAATNPQKRARLLMKFLDLANAEMDSLSRLFSSEHGETVPDARGDIRRGLEVIEFATGIPHLLKGESTERAGPETDVCSMRQPPGVVAGITPFNFPATIPLRKIGPAIACGDALILKPSERDPSVPLRIAELFLEAGLPRGVLNLVHGGREAVDAILHDKRVKAVGFVGAKDHALIMPDADLDMVADAPVGAAYGSAGERCVAPSVAVPVGRKTADALMARLVTRVEGLKIGLPGDADADYGPLVAAEALARVEDYVGVGVEEGAALVVDGRDLRMQGHEKGFGPVLTVVRADDYEPALKLPDEHEHGNGVAIFTRDGDAARDVASRVEVGLVGINVPIPAPIAYRTFGGWKASGSGDLNQHGPDPIRFYAKTKTATSRWMTGARENAFVDPTMG